ncbi:MAG TPA: hypothetical protein VIF09_18855, partial [Polyangiaceae bacterium]
MKTALTTSLSIVAGLGLVASSPQQASAETIPFTNLPVVTATPKAETPVAAPEKIPAGETTDGIFPAILPEAKRKSSEEQGYRYINVFASERDAKQFASDGTTVSGQPEPPQGKRTCLNQGGSLSQRLYLYLRTKPYTAPKPSPAQIQALIKQHRWPPPPQKPVKAEPQKDTVEMIHAERLNQSADSVSIETVDAYIDLNTLGTRTVNRRSTRLAKVAGGPNSLGIFAARDEKGNSQFLITNPELPPPATDDDRQAQVTALQSTANRLVAQLPTGGSADTGCGYVRFSLASKPGSGQMATVFATAFLPPSTEPDDTGPTEDQFESENMSEEQIKNVREMLRKQN